MRSETLRETANFTATRTARGVRIAVKGMGPLVEVKADPAFAAIQNRICVQIDLGDGRGYADVYVPSSMRGSWLMVNKGTSVWFLGVVYQFEDDVFTDTVIVEAAECEVGTGPPK